MIRLRASRTASFLARTLYWPARVLVYAIAAAGTFGLFWLVKFVWDSFTKTK